MSIEEKFVYETQFSMLIDEYPDKQLFPKFYEAKKIEITLNPGDRVIIPAGWFHWVFSETNDINVAINFWYYSDFQIGNFSYRAPIKSTHNLHNEIDYMQMLNSSGEHVVTTTDTNLIPQARVRDRFGGVNITEEIASFEEFYTRKDQKSYIASEIDRRLMKYAPSNPSIDKLATSRWWVNWGGGITTGLHFDNEDNWLYQLSGRKRILLFAPTECDKLYTINPYPPHFVKALLSR